MYIAAVRLLNVLWPQELLEEHRGGELSFSLILFRDANNPFRECTRMTAGQKQCAGFNTGSGRGTREYHALWVGLVVLLLGPRQ